MHTRFARIAPLLVLAAALVSACGGAGSSPAVGDQTATPSGLATAPASMAPAQSVAGDAMATFCQTWKADVAAHWPPDASTAARIAPLFAQWAQSPAFATVGADLTAVGTWLTAQASAASMTAPDADTTAAYGRIATFVTANCP